MRDHVVHDPVGGHGDRGAFGAEGEVVDFGGIEPLSTGEFTFSFAYE